MLAVGSDCYRAIGGAEALVDKAAEIGQRWLRGIGIARALKTATDLPCTAVQAHRPASARLARMIEIRTSAERPTRITPSAEPHLRNLRIRERSGRQPFLSDGATGSCHS